MSYSPSSYPPPIYVSEPDSFANYTLTQRLPDIGRRIIAENDFPREVVEPLHALIEELPNGRISPIADAAAPALEIATWEGYVQPYLGQRWNELPWYWAEAYFYRRVLAATGYFRTAIDPYAYQKQLGLDTTLNSLRQVSAEVNLVQGRWQPSSFMALVYFSLWGNRVDLSLFPAESGSQWSLQTQEESDNLLIDDTPEVVRWLEQHPDDQTNCTIDFIIDNSGFELFCDLCLADYLLTSQPATTVRFHVKPYPVFVSDAMRQDVHQTVDRLLTDPDAAVRTLALRLQQHLSDNRLTLHDHLFWAAPLVFWEMPDDLRHHLATARLVIVKGDANYRRLLGDRHWAFTTPFAEIVNYFPAPLAALRTLKAELACGLTLAQVKQANTSDPQWLTNGRRGVIQFANPL